MADQENEMTDQAAPVAPEPGAPATEAPAFTLSGPLAKPLADASPEVDPDAAPVAPEAPAVEPAPVVPAETAPAAAAAPVADDAAIIAALTGQSVHVLVDVVTLRPLELDNVVVPAGVTVEMDEDQHLLDLIAAQAVRRV